MIEQPSAATALAAADFWQTPKDTLYRALGSGPNGLSQVEADRRIAIFGANHADASPSRSVLRKLGQRLWNPLIAMLLAAALVSGLSGDVGSFVIIATVLSLSLTLDIVQEHRAERTAEALRDSVAIQADVVRDGKDITVPVTALVPGDIVKLRVGDLIPADGIVLDAQELQVNEALMTGEPFPGFRRGIVGLTELAFLSVDRRDIDDSTVSSRTHAVDHLSAHVERPVEISADHSIPLRPAHLVKRSVTNDPGIVDQNVDWSERGLNGLHSDGASIEITDVPLIGRDARSAHEGFGRLGVSGVGGSYPVARRLKRLRYGGTNTSGTARHQCHPRHV